MAQISFIHSFQYFLLSFKYHFISYAWQKVSFLHVSMGVLPNAITHYPVCDLSLSRVQECKSG